MSSRQRSTRFLRFQVEFVAQVMVSLANPPNSTIKERGTWLTGYPEWIEYFGLALSVHHSATAEPLGLTAFEAVFRNACEHLGWATDPPGSRTRRFVDLTVRPPGEPERRLSLKSTAARRLSKDSAHLEADGSRLGAGRSDRERSHESDTGAVSTIPVGGNSHRHVARFPRVTRRSAESLSTRRNPGQHLRYRPKCASERL